MTSAHEAREAEAGGADRLELVRSLEQGGLTPRIETVKEVLECVSIPVRVMLRENSTLAAGKAEEVERLMYFARAYSALPIDGFVLGFANSGELDLRTTERVLSAAKSCRATFHRAFDMADEPIAAITKLKNLPQIDRILTAGGAGTWQIRQRRLIEWERAAHPEIKIIVAIGLDAEAWDGVGREHLPFEIHTGRATRIPETHEGTVSRAKIKAIKRRLL